MTQSVRDQTLELVNDCWAEGLAEGTGEISDRLEDIEYNLQEGHITEAIEETIRNIAAGDSDNTKLYIKSVGVIHGKKPEIAVAVLDRLDELAAGKPAYQVISNIRTVLNLPRVTKQ